MNTYYESKISVVILGQNQIYLLPLQSRVPPFKGFVQTCWNWTWIYSTAVGCQQPFVLFQRSKLQFGTAAQRKICSSRKIFSEQVYPQRCVKQM